MASAAIIGAAVIGAAGSASAASKQSSAAKKAAAAQASAAAGTNALDLSIYNDQRDLLEPTIAAGAEATARQMLMQGIPPAQVRAYLEQTYGALNAPGPSLNDEPAQPRMSLAALRGRGEPLEPFDPSRPLPASATPNAPSTPNFDWVDTWEWQPNSPSYQFRFDEGDEAINRNLAARGLYGSGAAARRLTEFGQDLASTEFEADYNRFGALAGRGQSSTGQVINVGSNFADSVGQNNRYGADARASGYIRAGDAAAAGIRGAANSITGAIGSYGAYNGWWG